jgi:RNA polymerase-binding transcription factor DksA
MSRSTSLISVVPEGAGAGRRGGGDLIGPLLGTEPAVGVLDVAIATVKSSETTMASLQKHLVEARERLTRYENRRQTQSLVEGDRVNLTVEHVRGVRVVGNPTEGFTYQILVRNDRVAMRSEPFETEQAAQDALDEFMDAFSQRRDGRCVDCREVIPDERFDVFPDATRCLECQAKEDLSRAAEPDQGADDALIRQFRDYKERARIAWETQLWFVQALSDAGMEVGEIGEKIGETDERVREMLKEASVLVAAEEE